MQYVSIKYMYIHTYDGEDRLRKCHTWDIHNMYCCNDTYYRYWQVLPQNQSASLCVKVGAVTQSY